MVALDILPAIVFCQTLIDDGIIGVQKVEDAGIVLQNVRKKLDGFLLHGVLQQRVESWHKLFKVYKFEELHFEPLVNKVFGKPLAPWIVEHSFHLRFKDGLVGQCVCFCKAQ